MSRQQAGAGELGGERVSGWCDMELVWMPQIVRGWFGRVRFRGYWNVHCYTCRSSRGPFYKRVDAERRVAEHRVP